MNGLTCNVKSSGQYESWEEGKYHFSFTLQWNVFALLTEIMRDLWLY